MGLMIGVRATRPLRIRFRTYLKLFKCPVMSTSSTRTVRSGLIQLSGGLSSFEFNVRMLCRRNLRGSLPNNPMAAPPYKRKAPDHDPSPVMVIDEADTVRRIANQ